MNDFESTFVKSFNDFFEKNGIKGVCHRLKQSRFAPQIVDLLVDSLNPDYYLAIECKSIDATSCNALYFTQHFTTDKNGAHQVTRISDFLKLSGRTGFLAVELRCGRGRKKSAHAIPWTEVTSRFEEGVGFTVDEIREFSLISRRSQRYEIDPRRWLQETY